MPDLEAIEILTSKYRDGDSMASRLGIFDLNDLKFGM